LTLPDFRIYSVKSRRDYWGEQKAGAALASKRTQELAQSLKVRQLLRKNAEDLTWSEARTVLETTVWIPALSGKETESLRNVKLLYEAALEALPLLMEKASMDCGCIIRDLLQISPEQVLQGRELAIAFAQRAGDSLYGRLLHRARAHTLESADIEQVFRTLSATLQAAEDRDAGN
jgi:hypothetical protein